MNLVFTSPCMPPVSYKFTLQLGFFFLIFIFPIWSAVLLRTQLLHWRPSLDSGNRCSRRNSILHDLLAQLLSDPCVTLLSLDPFSADHLGIAIGSCLFNVFPHQINLLLQLNVMPMQFNVSLFFMWFFLSYMHNEFISLVWRFGFRCVYV